MLRSQSKIRQFGISKNILWILLLVEIILIIEKVQMVTLANAKSSPLPTFDFAEYTLSNFRLLGMFLSVTSISFWYLLFRSNRIASVRTCSAAVTVFLAFTLGSTSIIASVTHYWIQGFVISLFIQSIAFQVFAIRNFVTIERVQVLFSRKIKVSFLLKQKIKLIPNIVFFLVLTYATVYYPTMHFQFWDYVGQEGRFAMQNAFVFSQFPLSSFSLPGEKLSYHWGFDGLVAGFATFFSLPLDYFNFLFTVMLFILMCFQVDSLVQRLIPENKVKSSIITTIVLFGGGLPFYYGTKSISSEYAGWISFIDWNGIYILPPTISYFFQKSFAISIPIIFLYLGLMLDVTKLVSSKKKFLYVSIFLTIFCGLAISSATLFATAMLSSFFYFSIAFLKLDSSRIKYFLAIFFIYLIPVIYFVKFAGFSDLIFNRELEQSSSSFGIGILGTHASILNFIIWLIVSIGLFFTIYLYGMKKLRDITPIHQMIGLGFLLYFFLEFQGSVDMIKFMVLPRMLILVVLGLIVTKLLNRYTQIRPVSLVAAVLALVVSLPGLFFLKPLLAESFRAPHAFDGYTRAPFGPTKVVTFAKRMVGVNNFICSPELVNYCGVYGGLSQLNPDVLVKVQNKFPNRQENQFLLLTNPGTLAEYINLGFNFLIVGPDSGNWVKAAALYVADQKARVVFEADGYSLIGFN